MTHPAKYHDIAVRDLEMALEAFVLARLTAQEPARAVKVLKNVPELSESSYPGQAA